MGKTMRKFSNKSKKEKKNAIRRKTKDNRRNNKRRTYRKKVKGGGPTNQLNMNELHTKNVLNLDNNYKTDELYKIIVGYDVDYDTKELYEMIKNFKNIIIEFMNEINNSPKDITFDSDNITEIYNRLISQYELLIQRGKTGCGSNQECRKLKARYYFCAWYWMQNILFNFIEIDKKLWINDSIDIINDIIFYIKKLNEKTKDKIYEAFTTKSVGGFISTVDSAGINEFHKELADLGNKIREEFIDDKQLKINEEIKTKFSHPDPAMFVSNPLKHKK